MKKYFPIVIVLLVLCVAVATYFFALKPYLENQNNKGNVIQADDGSILTTENKVESSSSADQPNIIVVEYKYVIDTVAVEFTPNSSKYVGFRTCADSSCTVYGVDPSLISKAILGGSYRVSFNTFDNCGAAAGFTYCTITSDVAVESI